MSKGTKVVGVRIPPDLLAGLERIVAETADSTRGEPWTVSSLVVRSVREFLAHRERSRRPRRSRKARRTEEGGGQ